ncbi:MAG: cyanophycinase [Ignavibacteriae bacterium]|nr:MAG: cyanophycinase [Ignavibacteriota bacterium]
MKTTKKSLKEIIEDKSQEVKKRKGTLLIIGGKEDKIDKKIILTAVTEKVKSGKLVVMTLASDFPELMKETYEKVFRELGVKHLHFLDLRTRDEGKTESKIKILDDAVGIFFTGGDQHKITSMLGDTPIYRRIKEIYENGGVIAGTSAGAAVMAETMIMSPVRLDGTEERSFEMAPGLGFLPPGIIIDQHFTQRGRISRLLNAVALNPRVLGVGLDENTAIVFEHGKCFKVIGEGMVYIIDGSDVSYSDFEKTAYNLKVHLLSKDNEYDLVHRQPVVPMMHESKHHEGQNGKPTNGKSHEK